MKCTFREKKKKKDAKSQESRVTWHISRAVKSHVWIKHKTGLTPIRTSLELSYPTHWGSSFPLCQHCLVMCLLLAPHSQIYIQTRQLEVNLTTCWKYFTPLWKVVCDLEFALFFLCLICMRSVLWKAEWRKHDHGAAEIFLNMHSCWLYAGPFFNGIFLFR